MLHTIVIDTEILILHKRQQRHYMENRSSLFLFQ